MNRLTVLLLVLGMSVSIFAEDEYNPISTAVSLLTISPESRGSALGDAGAATSPDIFSQYWNPAKYAFTDEQFGVGLSYTPWLRALVNDIGLIDLTGFYRFDDLQTVSGSLRFFSLGEIKGTDKDGTYMSTIEPTEFALDVGYSRKFSENWSGAVVFRYIRSDLSNGSGDADIHAGNAFSADVATYYHNDDAYLGETPINYAFGLNISNIGSKLTYDDDRYLFLPANMKLGGMINFDVDDYNSVSITADINKLLVPTPPLDNDELDDYYDMGSLEGIVKSFSDAPGGFKEEMQEVMFSIGAEYLYNEIFAVRGGYFYEAENKGNREFFSVGAGFKMNVFSLDVSYLVPTDSSSPLANTLRFSLGFGVDGFKKIFSRQ